MSCTPVAVPLATKGKVEAMATQKSDVREITDEAVEAQWFICCTRNGVLRLVVR